MSYYNYIGFIVLESEYFFPVKYNISLKYKLIIKYKFGK